MKERVLCFLGDGGSFEGSENYGHRQMLPSLFVFSCFFSLFDSLPWFTDIGDEQGMGRGKGVVL